MWLLRENARTDGSPTEENEVEQSERRDFRTASPGSDRAAGRWIDPGGRALVIVGVMLVLVLTAVLPWIGGASGWQVIAGQADPVLEVGLLPRLFSINATVAGVLLGALTLATRRWPVAWITAMACSVVTVEGVIAIWSRQTVPPGQPGGPSFGLVLAVVAMAVLAVQWLRIVWSRP
ncbi:hypothetical protein CEP50_00365 [Actinopolyspora mortivallis]|uniref:Uncharacterized protein n=1 Tax=Actinopolyspora mortivallis TaxID=33906 RepID=A0A2T0H0X8_ACTMO|nr:hypothetical protein CEP50_00365 [Actinopolyspora mortivallis]